MRKLCLLTLLVSCFSSSNWSAGDTFYLSTWQGQKLLGKCRILSMTGGGAHSFTFRQAIEKAYTQGKKNGGIDLIEDSSEHAIWKLKGKTYAVFNRKNECETYLRNK